MSLARTALKVGRLSSVYALGSIIPRAIGIVMLPVFTYYLPPSQMGIVYLAARVGQPLSILVQLGLWSALKSQFFRTAEDARGQLVRSVALGQFGQGVLICAVLSIAGVWLAGVLLPNLPLETGQVLALWLLVLWGALLESFVRLGVGLAQLTEHAGRAISLRLSSYLTSTILGAAAVILLGWQGFGRQVTIFVGTALAATFAAHYIRSHSGGGAEARVYRRALRTGVTFVPHSLAGLLGVAINGWLLNKLASPAALGIYGVAIAFASLVEVAMQSISNATYPTLARLMSDGTDEAKRQQERLYAMIIGGVVFFVTTSAVLGPTALELLTAVAYHSAGGVLTVLILGWLFQGLYLIVAQPIFFHGGGLSLALATSVSAVVNIVLSLILIPQYGVYGAALALVGCFAARFVVAARISYRIYPLRWPIWGMIGALLAASTITIIDHTVSPHLSFWSGLIVKAGLLTAMVPVVLLAARVAPAELVRVVQQAVGRTSDRSRTS